MKQYRIEITALAEQDLEDVGDYFPYRNDCVVDSVLNQLGVRTEQFRNYVIYYIVNELKQIVYIVRILHTLVDGRNRLKKSLGLE